MRIWKKKSVEILRQNVNHRRIEHWCFSGKKIILDIRKVHEE